MQDLTVSIVSHRQGAMIALLLEDLARNVRTPLRAVVTINVPEVLPFDPGAFPFPVHLLRNSASKGFGANHNAAFREAAPQGVFCVANPDVRLHEDPFPPLLEQLEDASVGVVGPLARDPAGGIEHTFRRFPTPAFILRKALLGPPGKPEYAVGAAPLSPDWIGGMFMMLRAPVYAQVGGFDERYFLYYEDVDLCTRLRHAGYDVRLVPGAGIVHAGQRTSHRHPRYLAWHLRSMLRFWMSDAYRSVRRTSSRPR